MSEKLDPMSADPEAELKAKRLAEKRAWYASNKERVAAYNKGTRSRAEGDKRIE